jgi:hypothetical protein
MIPCQKQLKRGDWQSLEIRNGIGTSDSQQGLEVGSIARSLNRATIDKIARDHAFRSDEILKQNANGLHRKTQSQANLCRDDRTIVGEPIPKKRCGRILVFLESDSLE